MKKLTVFLVGLSAVVLSACSPVKISVKNQYQLSAYSTKQLAKKPMPITLLVTTPDAAAGIKQSRCFMLKNPMHWNLL
ncbi:Uncharacterised protein [Legionella bozemanae]|nr:Uncharacterised protein [Legionella bozemanae]